MSRPYADADVFRAIADPTRRRILDFLRGGEASAGEIAERIACSQPSLSQHMRVLRSTSLVSQRRRGRLRIYQLRTRKLLAVQRWLKRYALA